MPKKIPRKKNKKFRLLLDSAFAKPEAFPKLSKKANLAHCFYDLGLSRQAEDKEIYNVAVREDRFVLTINYKDFKKLARKGKPGVIAIESQLSNEEIDKLVTKFVSGKNPDEFLGQTIKV